MNNVPSAVGLRYFVLISAEHDCADAESCCMIYVFSDASKDAANVIVLRCRLPILAVEGNTFEYPIR